MSQQRGIDELKAKIERLEQQKSYLQRWDANITPLESFTEEDKIRIFDELYIRAHDYLRSYVLDGWEPKDGNHYIFEAVLSKMLGEEVWNVIRAIGN